MMFLFFLKHSPVPLVRLRNEDQLLRIESDLRRPSFFPEMTLRKQPDSPFIYCFPFKSLFPTFLRHIFSSYSRIIGNLLLICIKSLQCPSKEQTGSWFLIYNFSLTAHILDTFCEKTVNLLRGAM